MTTSITVETQPETQEPVAEAAAPLIVEAVTQSAHAEAVAEIVEEKIDVVETTVETVAETTTENATQLAEVSEWQTKVEGLLATLLDSQVKMMESQTAFNLAMSAQTIPRNSFVLDAEGTPTIAPANDASPSDPALELPVQPALEALESQARKVRAWI